LRVFEPTFYLDGVFSADGIDWTKFSGWRLSVYMYDMAAFAHTWAPLEWRWEARGVRRLSGVHAVQYAIMLSTLECKLG
jgi:hypothetical protein